MTRRIASAIFDTRAQAERAIRDLKSAGVLDRDISMLHQDNDKHRGSDHHDRDHSDNKGSGAAKGAAVGAGVGAVAGVAALAIPGIGPFIALGTVAEALGLVGSAAATSAVVGAAAGGIAGAMMDYGVSEDEARYYEKRVHDGGVWVGVDTTNSSADTVAVNRILKDAGGEFAESARATTY